MRRKWERHGEAANESLEYKTWRSIRHRCLSPSSTGYDEYGARGVTICAGWRDSFASFVADMGRRPTPAHSIDRKNSAGGYWCGHCEECVRLGRDANCRWATSSEQNRNKKRTPRYLVRGEMLCAADIRDRYGVRSDTFYRRRQAGWDIERAATTPPDPRLDRTRKAVAS